MAVIMQICLIIHTLIKTGTPNQKQLPSFSLLPKFQPEIPLKTWRNCRKNWIVFAFCVYSWKPPHRPQGCHTSLNARAFYLTTLIVYPSRPSAPSILLYHRGRRGQPRCVARSTRGRPRTIPSQVIRYASQVINRHFETFPDSLFIKIVEIIRSANSQAIVDGFA